MKLRQHELAFDLAAMLMAEKPGTQIGALAVALAYTMARNKQGGTMTVERAAEATLNEVRRLLHSFLSDPHAVLLPPHAQDD